MQTGRATPRTRARPGQKPVEAKAEDGREEHGGTLGGDLPTAVEGLVVGGVFDEECGRGAELATGREPLQQPRDEDDYTGPRADRGGRWGEGHDAGTDRHQRDRQGQGLLTTSGIGIVAEHHGTERADDV